MDLAETRVISSIQAIVTDETCHAGAYVRDRGEQDKGVRHSTQAPESSKGDEYQTHPNKAQRGPDPLDRLEGSALVDREVHEVVSRGGGRSDREIWDIVVHVDRANGEGGTME